MVDTWTCSCGNVNRTFTCMACGKKRDFFPKDNDYSSIFSPMKKKIPKRKRTKPSVWEEFKNNQKDEK